MNAQLGLVPHCRVEKRGSHHPIGSLHDIISTARCVVTSRFIGTEIVGQQRSYVKRLPAQADSENAAPEARKEGTRGIAGATDRPPSD